MQPNGEAQEAVRGLTEAVQDALHELCQPLTALHCRLEMARMAAGREGLREAVEGGLQETQRLFAAVARLRMCLQEEEAGAAAMAPVEGGPTVH